MQFIDSHCHLDFSEFDLNRESLINECVAKGVNQFVV
ncbi:MAG TPA: TatD family deoxyribonuclease, partial [Pseudoalteromonas sp.]|nr:TatD family deoxyribonuclease [Pseudoalteromonas sp.]HDY94041.1 TatD family deoxyribonuclease [Pseudoalteromonas sp.]